MINLNGKLTTEYVHRISTHWFIYYLVHCTFPPNKLCSIIFWNVKACLIHFIIVIHSLKKSLMKRVLKPINKSWQASHCFAKSAVKSLISTCKKPHKIITVIVAQLSPLPVATSLEYELSRCMNVRLMKESPASFWFQPI